MIIEFRNASSKRKDDLRKKKNEQDEALNARKRAAHDIKMLEIKREKLLEEKKDELLEIERELTKLRRNI